jgi:hypothetical protein
MNKTHRLAELLFAVLQSIYFIVAGAASVDSLPLDQICAQLVFFLELVTNVAGNTIA